jgi:hypothetical protein
MLEFFRKIKINVFIEYDYIVTKLLSNNNFRLVMFKNKILFEYFMNYFYRKIRNFVLCLDL